jgi:hypothetical protein
LLEGELASAVTEGLLTALLEVDDHLLHTLWGAMASRITPPRSRILIELMSRADTRSDRRAWLLHHASASLDGADLSDALRITIELPVEQRCEALHGLLPRLPETQRSTLLEQTLAEVAALGTVRPDGYSRMVTALMAVATHLEPNQLDRALDLVHSLADDSSDDSTGARDEALAAIAPRLAELDDRRGLEVIREIASQFHRATSLARAVPKLSSALLDDAAKIALTIDPVWRRDAVVALGRRIHPGETPWWLWEAVYAAATPDVWAGAGDHSQALEELAPLITPPIVTRVLEHTEKHPYASVRALPLAYLARFLPAGERESAWTKALGHAESEADAGDRADLLSALGVMVPRSMLRRVIQGIITTPRSDEVWSNPRARALAHVAPRLIELEVDDLRSLTGSVLRASRARPREELFWDLSALVPILDRLGQAALVTETTQAIRVVASRWP